MILDQLNMSGYTTISTILMELDFTFPSISDGEEEFLHRQILITYVVFVFKTGK